MLDPAALKAGRTAYPFALLLFATSVAADELKAFGHEIRVQTNASGPDALLVDSRILHRDEILTLEETAVVDGVPVLVGGSSPGGNSCDSSPFVISFPPDKPVRFDGPLENCNLVSWTVRSDRIEFATAASASSPGQSWIWTPSGFEAGAPVTFQPDAGKGWDYLRSRSVEHPSELMKFGEVATALETLLGPSSAEVLPILDGVGSASYEGDFLVATACVPHMCTFIEALVAADMRERALYVAWKPEDKPIEVRPPVQGWPEAARSALRRWAATWK